MAKDKELDKTLQFLGLPGEDEPARTEPAATQGKQTAADKELMKQHNFRMKQSEYERLQQHFDNKGLAIGAGIRMILKEYMKHQNV